MGDYMGEVYGVGVEEYDDVDSIEEVEASEYDPFLYKASCLVYEVIENQ